MPPIRMTKEEYQAKYGVAPVFSSTIAPELQPAPRRMTKAEYDAEFRPELKAGGMNARSTELGNTLANIFGGLTNTVGGPIKPGGTYEKTLDRINEFNPAYQVPKMLFEGSQKMAKEGWAAIESKTPGELAGHTAGMAAGGVQAALSVPFGLFESATNLPGIKPIKEFLWGTEPDGEFKKKYGINPLPVIIGNKVGDIKPLQDLVAKYENAPEVAADITTVILGLFGEKMLRQPKLKTDVQAELQAAYDRAMKVTNRDPGTPPPPGSPPGNGPLASEPSQLPATRNERITQDTAKYIVDLKTGIGRATYTDEQIQKLNDSATRIAEVDGLAGTVDESGTINPILLRDAINRYENIRMGDVDKSLVKNLLIEEAKTRDTSVSLDEIASQLTEAANNPKFSGAFRDKLDGAIVSEIRGLSKKVDEGNKIALAEIHQAKINESTSVAKDYGTLSNNAKEWKKAKAFVYKTIVERNSQVQVPVNGRNYSIAEINAELGKYLQDIQLMKDLSGRKVEGGRLGKYGAGVAGNIAGLALGSAFGPLGGAIGSGFGGMVAKNLQGKQMAKTFGKQRGLPVEENAVLKQASLTIPDVKFEVPKDVPKTPEMEKVEKQIEKNVQAQKKAIKKGDFSLVATLKEIYKSLVKHLKDLINKIKETPNKEGGFARNPFAKEVVKTEGRNTYNVGLSSVKGRIRQAMDDLADQADALIKEGKFDEAQKLFDKITTQAQRTIQNRFRGTGIEIKMKGTGFGVFEGNPEPNIDFTAMVKPGQDDLFHQVLTDLANKDFLQKSFLTHRPIEVDAKLGIIDKAKGIKNEPYLNFTFEKPLELKDVQKVNQILEQVGLEAMTLKDGNRQLDLLHLTEYNGIDYEKFIKQAGDFAENLNREGFRGEVKRGVSQTRFVGSETSGATTTFKRSSSDFYKKNKEYINPEINSKVLDAIKYRKEISTGELESIVNSGDISPTEKAVFKEVLDSLKGQASSKAVKADIRGPQEEISFLKDGRADRVSLLTIDNVKVGNEIKTKGDNYIITKVLKDGEFEAVPNNKIFPNETGYLSADLGYKPAPNGKSRVYKSEDVKSFSIPGKETSSKIKAKEITPGKIKTAEIQSRLRGKLLTLEPKVVEKYSEYGFSNLNSNFDSYKSVVFDSNLKHGRGKNHFEAEGMFGHGRYAMDYTTNKGGHKGGIASIGEIQSDVFQDSATVAHIKNFLSKEAEKLKSVIFNEEQTIKHHQNQIEIYQDAIKNWKKGEFPSSKESMKKSIKDYSDSLEGSRIIIENSKKELAELEKQGVNKDKQLLIDQFTNFARGDKYRDRLVQETINYINKTEKPKEILLPSPSTVAKIEGFAGGDDFAPYEIIEGGNGRVGRDAEDLIPGNLIDYGGEEMMVVDVQAQGRGWGGPPPTNIVVAPKDKVNKFLLSDFIQDEINYKLEEVNSEIDKLFPGENAQITTKQVDKILNKDIDDWALEKELRNILENDSPMTREELKGKVEQRITDSENENGWENLTSIYGEDQVFGHEKNRYDTEVYIVEDGTTPESFGQPNSYSSNLENISDIDTDIKLAKEQFDSTQMGVLENYYKIQDEFIPKLEKIIGKKIESVEDGSGNTWWKIDPNDWDMFIKNMVF